MADKEKIEINYDTPIEVTEKECIRIRKRFGQLIAWREDDEGRFFVKLWDIRFRDELRKELEK